MKTYVIHSKNGITCGCECNKAWKIDKYLDIKCGSCVRLLTGKLVLECEYAILNTTESSLITRK